MVYDLNGNIVNNPDLTRGRVYRQYALDGTYTYIYQQFTDAEIQEAEEAGKTPTAEQRIQQLEAALQALLEGAVE